MAWPFSRLRTYVANTTPTIKAADLNALQDKIIGLFAGTLSTIGLVLDGTGDQAVTPKAGGLKVTGEFSGTIAPTTDMGAGVLGLSNVCQGWARITSAGALVRGHNVKGVVKNGVGDYTITFNWQPVHGAELCPSYTVIGTGVAVTHECESGVDGGGYAIVQVRVFDLLGAAADRAVCAEVKGV